MKVSEAVEIPGLLCGVPYADIGLMLDLIRETDNHGHEMALTFCDTGETTVGYSTKGQPYSVQPPSCPSPSPKLGDFHTHPINHSHPSLGDWNHTIQGEESFFCVGWPHHGSIIGPSSEYERRQAEIECNTIDTKHPAYAEWRQRFNKVGPFAHTYNYDLVKRLHDEHRSSTSAEDEGYKSFQESIDSLVEEGREKGFIKRCAPFASFGVLEMPDIRLQVKAPSADTEAIKDCDTITDLMQKEYAFLKDQETIIEDPAVREDLCRGWKSSSGYVKGREDKARTLWGRSPEGSVAKSHCYDAIQTASLAKGKANRLFRTYCQGQEPPQEQKVEKSRMTVAECDTTYGSKELKALASQHGVNPRLKKQEICQELINKVVL